jgi:hypothetical protein
MPQLILAIIVISLAILFITYVVLPVLIIIISIGILIGSGHAIFNYGISLKNNVKL